MKLTILPDNVTIDVKEGQNLFDALAGAGIALNTSCGRKGTCGRCLVDVVEGEPQVARTSKKAKSGQVLSCQSTVQGDLVVRIPHDGRRLKKHKVLINEVELANPFSFEPLYQQVKLTLTPPDLVDNSDDLTRFLAALRQATGEDAIQVGLPVLRTLPQTMRESEWQITAGLALTEVGLEVVEVTPGHQVEPCYGLAIDIGTTTVKINLVDLSDGRIVAADGDYNRQQRYGDDVISRIIHASESPDNLELLRRSVLDTINDLLRGLLNQENVKATQVRAAAVAGNTTMVHLFLGILPKYIRLQPYIPPAAAPPVVGGEEAGLLMHPRGKVYTLPSVASYVGADITAGVLATQQSSKEELTLFIDIGTNGEIVLGNQDWLISCACSAGPCFEGSGIKCGMRAMDGAIDQIQIATDYNVFVHTLGKGKHKPAGICGSGLIDAIGSMLETGIINRSGDFHTSLNLKRLRVSHEEGPEFVLVWGQDSATGEDIVIQETDVKNVIRAKAAVFAGIRCLLKNVGLDVENIDRFLIAGGFGNSLNMDDAVNIGMLPDLPPEKFRFVGNTSLKGTQMVLTSRQAYQEELQLAKRLTYLELSLQPDFMDEFISASFLPHTDLTLFPSATKKGHIAS